MLHWNLFVIDHADHILVSFRIRAVIRHKYPITVEFVEDYIGASDMVCVRMSQYRIVQFRDSKIFQIRLNQGSFVIVTGINDHSVIILCEDHTVTLTDVYKMNGQITCICRQIGLCVLIDALCRLRCSVTDGSDSIISKSITGSTEKQDCDGTQ